eukprot:TRINITY_DN11602_c1_g1_i1.p1 TRINITY_DN11602_c1_g1~~TRINITY_DN11602_c1_g1_i1.p1  ORF type:complete len:442 (+),score=34.63 TRINITY_DN11602_c1_g1_i1:56-1381(+)
MVSVWSIVLLNVTALFSPALLPLGASLGVHVLFWDLLGVVGSVIPVAYSVQVLLSCCPVAQSLYESVAHAGGYSVARLMVLCEWMSAVVFTIPLLQFTAVALAGAICHSDFCVAEDLETNGFYLASAVCLQMLTLTALHCKGLDVAVKLLALLVAFGYLMPVVILAAGVMRSASSWSTLLENKSGLIDPAAAAVVFGFAGIEVSAFHGQNSASYKDAICRTAVLNFLLSAIGQLSIAALVPSSELDVSRGIFQALKVATEDNWLAFSASCALVGIGTLASAFPWLSGPIKGIAQLMARDHKPLMFAQNVACACIGVLFLCTPSSVMFLWLSALSSVTTQACYLLIFYSCWRIKTRDIGDVLVIIGTLTSLTGMGLAMTPTEAMQVSAVVFAPISLIMLALLAFVSHSLSACCKTEDMCVDTSSTDSSSTKASADIECCAFD